MITTIPDGSAEQATDPLDRRFVASAPNRCRVVGFTYVKTWLRIVYVAFVVGTFSQCRPPLTGVLPLACHPGVLALCLPVGMIRPGRICPTDLPAALRRSAVCSMSSMMTGTGRRVCPAGGVEPLTLDQWSNLDL
ncbi:hypothetical protein ACFWJS_41355 [Streptomyces sp. NPDC127061]|uniref:hypothetical protein n=1 Tax=Streptomyces sp. NPDC127061 TaxID=3347122 RepID=UPI00364882EC